MGEVDRRANATLNAKYIFRQAEQADGKTKWMVDASDETVDSP